MTFDHKVEHTNFPIYLHKKYIICIYLYTYLEFHSTPITTPIISEVTAG
jgi:hypothetical protein